MENLSLAPHHQGRSAARGRSAAGESSTSSTAVFICLPYAVILPKHHQNVSLVNKLLILGEKKNNLVRGKKDTVAEERQKKE